MPLLLQFVGQTGVPVEIEGLTPQFAKTKSLAELERFPIWHGNWQLPLAEMFGLSGDPGDGQLRFEGDLAGVHKIGANMSEGAIFVAGSAGRHVGSEMTGGKITVAGDAGDWVGGEMHGGSIHVRGNAGRLAGAAYRGSRRGMTDGTILIDGDAGDEIGYAMRRGLIAVGGSCGDCPGFHMIAGSIYVFGNCGIRPGAGMRRGTIGLFGPKLPPLLSTFKAGGNFEPQFLHLTMRELRKTGFRPNETDIPIACAIFHGDMLESGRGEILLRA